MAVETVTPQNKQPGPSLAAGRACRSRSGRVPVPLQTAVAEMIRSLSVLSYSARR